MIKPKLYVLAIGVSDYEDKNLALEFAAKDAGDFARVLEDQAVGLYREVKVNLILDRMFPTRFSATY